MSSTGTAVQVAQFLNNLALGWKHVASYPAGHPILVNSLRTLNEQLTAMRGPAGEVVFGIGVDGVLYGTLKIDSIPAQKFAQALYTRGVAFVRFGVQTTSADIEAFL